MKICITGAAGFIGSHLAESLLAEGHDVYGIDCFTNYYAVGLKRMNAEDLQNKGVIIHDLDLATDSLDEVMRDAEVVYHLAAQPGLSATTSFETYVRNNLTATHRLLDACRHAPNFKSFINIGTSSIYGKEATSPETATPKPASHYGVTKLAAEQLALSYHRQGILPACSMRLFSVYGPRERPDKLYPKLIRSILHDTEFPLFEGSEHHSRSFTYVGDIVKGMHNALSHIDSIQGEVFNIGSDIESTTGRAMDIVQHIMETPANIVIKPKRAGDQLKTHANIDKARQYLGYSPDTTLEEGLRAMVEWHTVHEARITQAMQS